MALALTLLSLFTLVGLALSAFSGWALSHAAGATAARHIALAVPTVLFSLFTQSMILFFFIGTGKMLKEAAAKSGDPQRLETMSRRVRELKMRTSALATFTPLSVLVAGLLGVTAHTGRTPGWLHLWAVVLAVGLHLVAFGREVVAMSETNQLLDESGALEAGTGDGR